MISEFYLKNLYKYWIKRIECLLDTNIKNL